MKLSLTVQTPEVPVILPVALLSGTFEEKLIKAARFGAQGIELVTTEPSGLDAGWISDQLRLNGLELSGVASGAMAFAAKLTLLSSDSSIAEVARQRLDEMIALAGRLGAPLVTVGSFRGRAQENHEHSLHLLAQILRSAGNLAAAAGVRIAIEPLNRFESDLINTVDQGLAFLEEVDHPSVGLLLDTFHVNIEESSWTEPFIRANNAGKLFHVHLADNNRQPPSRGLIDFHAILSTLDRIGYTGWLTAELIGLPDPDTAAQETVEIIIGKLKEISVGKL
jgi:5-keto-L-gluconate epimerase